MAAAATGLEYNPYAFAIHEDPYETYRRLREEAPVYRNDDLAFWALSRFADVHEGFRDFATYSSAQGIALEARGRTQGLPMMITLDPPEHTLMRKLVSRIFTPRAVAEMESTAREIVTHYLDRVVDTGECDLVADFTGPFPMDVISVVLGVPEADRAELRRYADQILVREDGSMQMPEVALDGFASIVSYFASDLPARRAATRPGLITELARAEVDGRALTDEELLGFALLFIIAGHETTTKMVANAVELLSRHPDQRTALVSDLSLVPGCVEEVLRYHNSTQYMHRTLTRDVELHGRTMHTGDSVLLLIGSANHDEREFGPDADRFDITRAPGRHIAFGYGPHFCLGAGLARLEGRVALEEIHRRLPDYDVDHERTVRFHSGNVTGWTSLPVSFGAGQASGAR